jgi:hypothetical protein
MVCAVHKLNVDGCVDLRGLAVGLSVGAFVIIVASLIICCCWCVWCLETCRTCALMLAAKVAIISVLWLGSASGVLRRSVRRIGSYYRPNSTLL